MAKTPTRDITFRRGDTYQHVVTVTGVDVSAWTFNAQIRRSADDRDILATFAKDMTSAATGVVELSLQEVDTIGLPLNAVWDVQVVIAGDTFTIFAGDVTVERDVTRV